jgi:hypothetical protein
MGGLIINAVWFLAGVAVAFAFFLGGIFLTINAISGSGFVGRQGRILKVVIPGIVFAIAIGIAITITILFMETVPRPP